jgi:steroid 5-alpha reductase family enzyme
MDTLSPVTLALIGLVAVSLAMALLWALQARTGNAGVVDAGWALSIGGLATAAALLLDGWVGRRMAIAVVMAIWSIRLGSYLLRDRVIGRPEDGRYVALRQRWGTTANVRFFWFFQIQAAAALFFALPAFIAAANPRPKLSAIELIALCVWALAFAGEALADRQLARFKADPAHRGRTCRSGFWRYTRHPNYFFEWLMWVAYALFALPSPWGVLALACPAGMLYLLLRVTGIPATEEQSLRSRGDDYRRYQETTSAFFPWTPRE